jgi:hypothetical protein
MKLAIENGVNQKAKKHILRLAISKTTPDRCTLTKTAYHLIGWGIVSKGIDKHTQVES